MKKVLIDASSAILLFKADLFGDVLKKYHLRMSRSVYDELTVQGYPGAAAFADFSGNNQLAVLAMNRADSCRKSQISISLPLTGGERDTIVDYAAGMAEFIIIDDKRGAAYCRKNYIPYVNAVLCARILYLYRCLSQADYRHKTDEIVRIGRYSQKIIDYAVNCSRQELAFFKP